MITPIGRQLQSSPRDLALACGVTVLAIAGDMALFGYLRFAATEARWAIALVALAVHVRLVRGDLASVGLVGRPAQGWGYWVRATVWIGLAVAAIIAVAMGLWVLAGGQLWDLRMYAVPPERIAASFVWYCVYAPLLEETLYRLVLCVPLAAAFGPWAAIVVSGTVFGALHVVYGNPSPENLFGGLFLAWAYLKSGTIVMPLLLHSLGNLVVLATHVAAWYWLVET